MAHSPTPWTVNPVELCLIDDEGNVIAEATEGASRLEALDNLRLMAAGPSAISAAIRVVREYRQFVLPGGSAVVPIDFTRAVERLERVVKEITGR